MQQAIPLACFLSLIRPPGVRFEEGLLQILPVNKAKCPFVKNNNDVSFQLYTRHNPTVPQELLIDDDEKLFASNIDFTDPTVVYFGAWMEQHDGGSGVLVREAYMLRGDTNVIMVDARHLEAGPWYFTAAENTWYIGNFAAQFIDYLVSRGLKLSKTHLVGHSLGAQSAGVAGSALKTGRVSRITGLDPALPLFDKLPLQQKLDASDAEFVDVIHTDAGIFGYKHPMGHADFYPNGGISPQPGCELEVVLPQQQLTPKLFCSHWRSYQFYSESVIRPKAFVSTSCPSWKMFSRGRCADQPISHMGLGVDTTIKMINNKTEHGVLTKNLNVTRNNTAEIKIQNTVTKQTKPVSSDIDSVTTKPDKFKYNHAVEVIAATERTINYDSVATRKKRVRRFISLFRRSETESDNFLFKILEFLMKNRKNVIPVVTVMREINTLVKSANGELNHLTKERNNYIGTLPSALPTAIYNLELGNDSKLKAIVKRLLGLGQGDKLTITGSG
ncbi:pancreatic lipase-related protein 2 [Aphomia sociella]